EPSVDCIIVARPTQSAPLYQQMLGRGTRTYPGKTDCLVLDVVGVSTHHTLHTAATLFDCDAERLARQSILELLERPVHQDQEEAALTGTLRSTPVDLFTRRALRWVQTRQGAWVLSLGAQHGTLRLRSDGPETWQVVQVRRDAEPVPLGDTLPLPYAQGLAEDYARHLGVARLVEAEAPWRQHPASEKQTALLRKLGIASRAGLTKGEAAELLAAGLGDWGWGQAGGGKRGVPCRSVVVPAYPLYRKILVPSSKGEQTVQHDQPGKAFLDHGEGQTL